MDLPRMLTLCQRDQWRVADLDFSLPCRPLPEAEERFIVQMYTDMAVIEELAGALFREQARRTLDPTLRAIFLTFVADEARHAAVARRLAERFDRRRDRPRAPSPALSRFVPPFLAVIRDLPDDVANAYITTGELILDIALLRTLAEHVADPVCQQAMALINRDESRHIAVDYHMLAYYASPDYQRRQSPAQPLLQRLVALRSLLRLLYRARPFIEKVFFAPMDHMDPDQERILAAFKRVQLLGNRPGVRDLPFTAFLRAVQGVFMTPVAGSLLGPLLCRIAGVPPRFLSRLCSEEEQARADRMSFAELAEEALRVKTAAP